jgi:hypothetical protein
MAELLRPPPMGSMKARVATAERAQRSALASPRAASTAGGRPPAHAAASAGAHLRVCRLSAVLQSCRSGNTARRQRDAPLAKLANRLALIGNCCAQRRGSERCAQLVGPPQRVCEVRGQRVQVRSPKGGSAWARGGMRRRERESAEAAARGGAPRARSAATRRHSSVQSDAPCSSSRASAAASAPEVPPPPAPLLARSSSDAGSSRNGCAAATRQR